MSFQLRNKHLFAGDVVLVAAAVYLSLVLRLERFDLGPYWPGSIIFGAAAVAATTGLFLALRLYSRHWRYASVEELRLIVAGVTVATVMADVAVLIAALPAAGAPLLPRSTPLIFWPLALIVTAGPRFLIRLRSLPRRAPAPTAAADRALIVGAGDSGALLARELHQGARAATSVVGLVDDDPALRGVRIHGLPVLGPRSELPALVRDHEVRTVIIAMPEAPGRVLREIVDTCERAGARPLIMPALAQLLDSKVGVSQLRDVQIEDLLRREPVRTDTEAVRASLRGRRVLVTGGGGSIGSELCRQIFSCRPEELVILGHGENSVFEIHGELQRLNAAGGAGAATRVVPVIADVRFPDRMRNVFARYRPEVVFHAAAHKHVPLMECNPAEAITTNVLGTRNVLAVAEQFGVGRFVMISSDKAVNPTSVMGASKRVAELLVHETARRTGGQYLAVRFGNVLGSRGSVMLTFRRQIAAGGPVTVTHPEMRRFFMTIPEAVQLVLQASILGHGGEVCMLDMGEPVRIADLARDMIELSGLEVGRDIDLIYTGVRPGEKLYEELFVAGERYRPTIHSKIFVAQNDSSFLPASLEPALAALAAAAAVDDNQAIMGLLRQLIPTNLFAHDLGPAEEEPRLALMPPLVARTIGGS